MNRLVREPDFGQFLKVLRREGKPSYLPFYEHIASPGFIARRTETKFNEMTVDDPDYWPTYVDFWLGLGFDCIPMEVPPKLPLPEPEEHGLSHGSEAFVSIRSREDFEKYHWPDPTSAVELRHFETVAKLLPDNVKIVGGVAAGPFEWATRLLGVMGLSYMLADDPELVGMVFEKLAEIYVETDCRLTEMDAVGALRQGDDLGFKTSTFLRPEDLRKYVFPIYGRMVMIAHERGKPFVLHSCGDLGEVYDDLIDDCGIDAKHSFEDVILPVEDFKKRYGSRVTALGGLDVDTICRSTRDELRAYARRKIEACFADGFWALGTGNSLTDYMPVENYVAVLEEGLEIAG